MKKLILIATGFVFLVGGPCFVSATQAQTKEDVPHRVGLIDMGYVFSKYEKLKYLQQEMQAEVQTERNNLNKKVERIKELQLQIKDYNEGSPDYVKRDSQLTKLMAEIKTENKVLTHTFQQKQAKIYHTIYLEVQDAVEKMCKHHNFTVIIQFTRPDGNSTDPKKVSQVMNQSIVYHRKRDDLTDGVLKYLNDKYVAPTADEEKAAAPAQTTRPPTPKGPKKDKQLQPAGGPGPADR